MARQCTCITHGHHQQPLTMILVFFIIVYPLQNELESRQKKGLIDRTTLVLAIEDPARDVGSGGATLNALYITAEHLGTRQVRELSNLSLVFRLEDFT